jgi:hypothetical protein
MKTRPGSIRPEGVREVKLERYITTLTIVHNAESYDIAARDATVLLTESHRAIDAAQRRGDVGAIEHVTIYSTQKAR